MPLAESLSFQEPFRILESGPMDEGQADVPPVDFDLADPALDGATLGFVVIHESPPQDPLRGLRTGGGDHVPEFESNLLEGGRRKVQKPFDFGCGEETPAGARRCHFGGRV
jgi:hypothetical protein